MAHNAFLLLANQHAVCRQNDSQRRRKIILLLTRRVKTHFSQISEEKEGGSQWEDEREQERRSRDAAATAAAGGEGGTRGYCLPDKKTSPERNTCHESATLARCALCHAGPGLFRGSQPGLPPPMTPRMISTTRQLSN